MTVSGYIFRNWLRCTGVNFGAVTLFCFHTAPSSPSYIHVVSQTQTNLTIEWGHPDLVNGVLRSFLVNIEEIESFNSTACCEYFPVREVAVQPEKMNYSLEVSFISDNNTYYLERIESSESFYSST